MKNFKQYLSSIIAKMSKISVNWAQRYENSAERQKMEGVFIHINLCSGDSGFGCGSLRV